MCRTLLVHHLLPQAARTSRALHALPLAAPASACTGGPACSGMQLSLLPVVLQLIGGHCSCTFAGLQVVAALVGTRALMPAAAAAAAVRPSPRTAAVAVELLGRTPAPEPASPRALAPATARRTRSTMPTWTRNPNRRRYVCGGLGGAGGGAGARGRGGEGRTRTPNRRRWGGREGGDRGKGAGEGWLPGWVPDTCWAGTGTLGVRAGEDANAA